MIRSRHGCPGHDDHHERPPPTVRPLPFRSLRPSAFSLAIYGEPSADADFDGLLDSIREHGVLVPLVVARRRRRRLGNPLRPSPPRLRLAFGLDEVPCQVARLAPGEDRRRAVIEYNRQRRKTFRQIMREADALHDLHAADARRRQWDNLAQNADAEGRNSDARRGRTDSTVAQAIGLGGKDLYRQARAIWKAAEAGDVRAERRPRRPRRRDQDDPRGL